MTAERRPGRPRSAAADAAILRATLELLAEEGLQGIAFERVAARAGVAKTTVYRRFAAHDELVRAALSTLAIGAPPERGTGTARGDLMARVRRRVAQAPATAWNLLTPRLVVESARDPELHALVRSVLVDPERAAIADILRRGIDRGELPPDLDVEFAIDALVGPLVYRVLIDRGDVATWTDRAEKVFDLLARGAGTAER